MCLWRFINYTVDSSLLMMIQILISFLFVCWNNKVTAAGTVPSKTDKKQPLNDIWSPTAFLLHSLRFVLVKIALYCLYFFFSTCPSGFFFRTVCMLTSKQWMQFLIRQQSLNCYPCVTLGFVDMQNAWMRKTVLTYLSIFLLQIIWQM